jgi:plastocyanin
MLLATGPAWAAGDPTVTIDNFTFSPPTITVPAGSRIIWVNHDDIPHVVAVPTAASLHRRWTPTSSSPGASRSRGPTPISAPSTRT